MVFKQQRQPLLISLTAFVIASIASVWLFWLTPSLMLMSFIIAALIAVSSYATFWSRSLAQEIREGKHQLKVKERELSRHHREILEAFSQLQKAQERIAVEQDKAGIILESVDDGVFVIDGKGRVVLFNNTASDMSGYAMDEVLGRRFDKTVRFIDEQTGKQEHGFVREALTTCSTSQAKRPLQLLSKDGKTIEVDASATPIRNATGNIIGCVVVFRDRTRERRMEIAKTDFLSIASHQLRSPLTSIKLFLELFEKDIKPNLTREHQEYLEIVQQSADRMIQLIDELLNASRLEGARLMVRPRETDVEALVQQLIKEVHMIGRWKGCVIRFERMDHPLPLLRVDPGLLREVVMNLLTNAIRYSQENKCAIVVGIQEKDDAYVLYVKDAGIGIPKEAQDRIFEKFFRADNARKTVTEGSGLGMYIIKMIVDLFGGRIWFDSELGKGSCFFVAIPKEGMKAREGDRGLQKTKTK